jgi:glycosyltransferase involved in cell wall biosynthesis
MNARIAFHSENGPAIGGSDMVMGRLCDGLPPGWAPHLLVREEYPVAAVLRRPERALVLGRKAGGPSREEGPVAVVAGKREPLKRRLIAAIPAPARYLFGLRRIARGARRLLADAQIDLLHTMDGGPQAIVVGGRQAGAATVATYQAPPPAGGYLERWAARRSYHCADVCLAPSLFTKNAWSGYLGCDGSKIEVVPNGIDASRFAGHERDAIRAELGIPRAAAVVGFTGRLEPYKGCAILAAAAPAIARAVPDAYFVFTGSGASRPALERTAERSGLAGRCRFLGFRADVERITNVYDVAVVPSTFPEPFGLVALEAMACSRPVVASAIGGLVEIVRDGETGFLPPAGDVDALGKAVVQLLADPELAASMGRAGYQRVRQEFMLERQLATTYSVYSRLLERADRVVRNARRAPAAAIAT